MSAEGFLQCSLSAELGGSAINRNVGTTVQKLPGHVYHITEVTCQHNYHSKQLVTGPQSRKAISFNAIFCTR